MKAAVGDVIMVPGHTTGQKGREGEVLEVHGEGGAPPYLVRWDDGHTGLVFPGPEAQIHPAKHGAAQG